MPSCPACGRSMAVQEVASFPGIDGKQVSWHCAEDGIEAAGVHPVQISHLHVGDETVRGGRRTRIVKLEMHGAELLVFHQLAGEG